MSKKVLITGVTGQDGSLMVDYLLKNTDYSIVGTVRRLSVSNHQNISHVTVKRFKLLDLDVTDSINTTLIVQEEKPDYFINFAANSFVGTSWKMPVNHMNTNAMPVMYQLEALRRFAPNCRYYNAGSSEQFGDVDYSPQDIYHPFKPRSHYGVSKCTAHHIVKGWRESYNMYAVQGILFNHEGVRRGEEFLPRKISKGVARIKKAINNGVRFDPILVGNLESSRDWSDAEDFVDGIWKMLNQKKPEDYVLASGEAYSIKELIDFAFKAVNISCRWEGKNESMCLRTVGIVSDPLVKVSKELFRPAEVNLLCGYSFPAKEDLKWEPKTSFEELIKKMVLNDLKNGKT